MREIRLGLMDEINLCAYTEAITDGLILAQLRLALLHGVNIMPYIQEGYDAEQLNEIRISLECGVDIHPYLNKALFGMQLCEIRIGLLNKVDVSKYCSSEYNWMQMHEIRLGEIIERFDFIDDKEFYQYCYDICRYHHEKYDGQGYPEGLKGDDIPIAAQIVALADVFDALVSERIYKEKYPPQKSIQMILEGECGLFNPKLLKCFIKVKDDFVKAEKL